ncbi:glucose-6-phosphate isomerase [Sporolactobacillus sp. KGMB 08714]|uniref:glucose-6-phosphate isomerase n=1 Tax=Sporolactobacillus sp. KGMB 08714 TaxID=3064704 RepID=UPI002FBE49C2
MLTFDTKTTSNFPKKEFETFQDNHLSTLKKIIETNPDTDAHKNDLGWFKIDKWASDQCISELNVLAEKVRNNADVLVLVGVGGSNQAARAVIEALSKKNAKCKIVYAGINLSANYYNKLLDDITDKEVYVDIIAKNFETLEPGIGFRIFKPFLQKKYGNSYSKHMIVTGTIGSPFEELAKAENYPFLIFPTDIGGRYSAFSDVGLFPMAVAGIDITELIKGAREIRNALQKNQTVSNPAYRYACFRNYLLQNDYKIEILAHFEPQLDLFGRWWTQLFAESEGKEDKGIYPVSLSYSEDLHSVGQYVQQGQKDLLETFLIVDNKSSSLTIQPSHVGDNFDYLNGKDLWDINKVSEYSTIEAHRQINVPVFEIHLSELSTKSYGELFYFFEFAVYISGTILDINPFDQPGVEAYKTLMFKGLGK